MRVLLSLIATLIVSACAFAQNTDNQFHITYRGSAGFEYFQNEDDEQLSIFVIHGAQLTPQLFAGAGIGFPFIADIANEEPRHWVDYYSDAYYYEKEPGIWDIRYENTASYHEKEHGIMGGQVFLDLKYHFYDKNITPFVETTYGAGRKFCGDNFINCSLALGIRIFPASTALVYDLYYKDRPVHFFGARFSASWGKNMFKHW